MPRCSRVTILLSMLLLATCFMATTLAAQPRYHSYQELTSELREIVRAGGAHAAIRSIGKSPGGRDIWGITIGTDPVDKRPAVLVVGGVDGASPVGSELALRFVRGILADRSDSTRRLLERVTFYVIPRVNPDAIEQYFGSPRYERSVNTTSTDDDRDGAADEDGYDDLDADGLITSMRVRSASGSFIADPDDPRFLRRADAARGERGEFEIYSEGRDNDNDGRYNEDGPGGVDFNRNFPFAYPYFQAGAGAHQVSEPETRAVADFCYDHQNIALVFAFAPQNNLVNPWETRSGSADGGGSRSAARIIKTVREEDQETMKRVASFYKEIAGVKDAPAYVKGEGSFVEWAYYHYGRMSFGTTGWSLVAKGEEPRNRRTEEPKEGDSTKGEGGRVKGENVMGDSARGEDARNRGSEEPKGEGKGGKEKSAADTLRALERMGVSGGYVPWRKINHPDFPGKEVEVGGFAPFVRNSPPAGLLDSLGLAHTRFLTFLGSLLPRVEKADIRTERLGSGVTRITLELVNTGLLPTLAKMGETSRVPLDVKAELELSKGQTVASGRRVQLLGPVAGSGGSKQISWIVVGSGSVLLKVSGPMAGGFTERVEL